MCRWVKFEKDIEEEGNRWSKPHVATLSLRSLHSRKNSLTNLFTQLLTHSLTVLCRWVKFEENIEEGGNRWSKLTWLISPSINSHTH